MLNLCFLQKYLELDDQTEQERRAMRGREKERERRERQLEKKAREQADQCEFFSTTFTETRQNLLLIESFVPVNSLFYLLHKKVAEE